VTGQPSTILITGASRGVGLALAEWLYNYIENLQPNTAEGFAVAPDKVLPW